MKNAERQMTNEELSAMTVDGVPGMNLVKNRLTPSEKFTKDVIKQEQDALKKGLPFARHAARDDASEYTEKLKQTIKRLGSLPDNFPKFSMDWKKYSDLKNFELINEKEVNDDDLSKKNPGLNVKSLAKVYQYNGYDNKYIVMEDGPSSIRRAVKARALLDKQIAGEIKAN